MHNVFPPLRKDLWREPDFERMKNLWLSVLNIKRIEKRSDLYKYEFILQVFTHPQISAFIAALFRSQKQCELCTYIIHVTCRRERRKQYGF